MWLEFFRNRPDLAAVLLRLVFGMDIPDGVAASLGSETFTECDSAEFRCDATIMLGDPLTPDVAIVVEVQLRWDDRKRYTWPT
jgi:hypothetical protein